MSVERSRQLGQALMGASLLSVLFFFMGILRRSYAALALPLLCGVSAIAGIGFWVGYTMTTTQWDHDLEDS